MDPSSFCSDIEKLAAFFPTFIKLSFFKTVPNSKRKAAFNKLILLT